MGMVIEMLSVISVTAQANLSRIAINAAEMGVILKLMTAKDVKGKEMYHLSAINVMVLRTMKLIVIIANDAYFY
jgi:hypothetical protein